MNSKSIDILNIGLVLFSLVLAILIPFKLFLFAYAILGPLHYLTEINWLKDKKYFIKTKKIWLIIFVIFALFIAFYNILNSISQTYSGIRDILGIFYSSTNLLLLTGFLFAISLIFLKKSSQIILALAGSFAFSYALNFYLPDSILFISLFLPSLIHVYIFTILFILYGALKSNSKFGIYNVLLLLLVPIIIYYLPLNSLEYKPSKTTIETFSASNMTIISSSLAKLFNQIQNGKFYPLSSTGIKIQIFVSFAYTYHYLNWFSKTSIIGWKNALTTKSSILILSVWILSIAVYTYDYKTGFMALLFLSILHVFLEFPLNTVTVKEVYNSILSKS